MKPGSATIKMIQAQTHRQASEIWEHIAMNSLVRVFQKNVISPASSLYTVVWHSVRPHFHHCQRSSPTHKLPLLQDHVYILHNTIVHKDIETSVKTLHFLKKLLSMSAMYLADAISEHVPRPTLTATYGSYL